MSDTGGYGSYEHPLLEQTFTGKLAEVHWGGAYGVLTVTILEASDETLDPQEAKSIGDYAVGAPIPFADNWKGDSIVAVDFIDTQPVETVVQLPDQSPTGGSGPVSTQACLLPGAPSRAGLPEGDPTADMIWNSIQDAYSAASARASSIIATMELSAAVPGAAISSVFDLTAILADNEVHGPGGAIIADMPGSTKAIGFLYPPVAVQYMIAQPGGFFAPPPVPGVSGTTAQAYSNFNGYEDAVSTVWTVLRITGSGGPIPGHKLVAVRDVYLIDFGQLAKEHPPPPPPPPPPASPPPPPPPPPSIIVKQGWSNVDPEFGNPDYQNSYRLQIYGSAENFVAGSQRTVRLKPGLPDSVKASYDVTRTVAWNDGSQSEHGVLHFDKTGWLATSLPATAPALSEAMA